jgi:hypothetical protein
MMACPVLLLIIFLHFQVCLTSGRDQVVDEVLAPQALKVIDDNNNTHIKPINGPLSKM